MLLIDIKRSLEGLSQGRAVNSAPDGPAEAENDMFKIRVQPFASRAPEVICMVTANKEKKAQGAARKLLEGQAPMSLLASLVDSSEDAIIASTLQGVITSWNPAAERMFGYRAEEVVGRLISFLEGPGRQGEMAEILEKIGNGERLGPYESERRRKDGSSIFISLTVSPIYDPKGQLIGVYSINRDITERKLVEIRYRHVFETAGEGILILDADTGRIIDANPLLLELLGYSGEDLRGEMLWDIGALADVAASKTCFMALPQKEYLRYEDLPLLTRDGRRIHVEFISSMYPINGGKLIQCSLRDITEGQRAQEEITRLKSDMAARAAELESVNRDLEAFNHTVAHDLRKPLTAVSGYCQMLQEMCGDRLDEKCSRYLQEAYQGTWRMNLLIDTLLKFSSLTRIEPRRVTLPLDELAREVAAELQFAEPERAVEFRIAEGVTVEGDPALLRVVLENLLGNAWKYTAKQQAAVIEFGVTQIDGRPVFMVRDNGVGFLGADAKKLFIAFQRLPGSEEFQGFGVGLATVERIIRGHGGKVWAEGEPGKGASFYFTLPVAS